MHDPDESSNTTGLREYLLLFSNEGPVRIEVRFRDGRGMIACQQMRAGEILRFVEEDGVRFREQMTFDEHPCRIRRVAFWPEKAKLVIDAERL